MKRNISLFLVEIAVQSHRGFSQARMSQSAARCAGAHLLGASWKFLAKSVLGGKFALVTVGVLFLPSCCMCFPAWCVFSVGAKKGIQLSVISLTKSRRSQDYQKFVFKSVLI